LNAFSKISLNYIDSTEFSKHDQNCDQKAKGIPFRNRLKYLSYLVSIAGTTAGINMSMEIICCVSFVKQFQWGLSECLDLSHGLSISTFPSKSSRFNMPVPEQSRFT